MALHQWMAYRSLSYTVYVFFSVELFFLEGCVAIPDIVSNNEPLPAARMLSSACSLSLSLCVF